MFLHLIFGSQQASNIEYNYLIARKKLEIHEKFRKKIWTEETFWKTYYSYTYTGNNALYPKETFCNFIDMR